jgi:hypothetical protein
MHEYRHPESSRDRQGHPCLLKESAIDGQCSVVFPSLQAGEMLTFKVAGSILAPAGYSLIP